MCIKNDSKLKTCLKFLKTSFFAGKRPYFSLQNCPGDWDRIYRIVTSIDLIAFPRTQCFCYKSPQNVDIVQQYRGSFRNFQDLQWERTSRRKNRAVLGLIKPDNDEHLRCLLFFRTVVRMLIKVDDLSWLYISGSTSVVRFLCWVLLGFIKNIKALVFT